jgi:hypothetical protein
MTNNQENGESSDTWLTPSQVSKEFDIVQRRVYRWIERKQVVFRVEAGKKFVSRDSVKELLSQEQMRQLVSDILPENTPGEELRQSVTTSLVRNDVERSQLYAKSLEDARTIGELTEKTRHLDTLEIKVSGLRQDKVTLTARYERYRVLFWVTLALFVIVISVMSVILYVNM